MTYSSQSQEKPNSEEYQQFRQLADEFERLNTIPEGQRTDAQRTAHGELLAELALNHHNRWLQWSWKGQSPDAMNNAFTAHVAKTERERGNK